MKRTDNRPDLTLAYLVVLAIHATEVAMRKEDCARAPLSGNRGFLTEVRQGRGDRGIGPGPAVSVLAMGAVHSASPGT